MYILLDILFEQVEQTVSAAALADSDKTRIHFKYEKFIKMFNKSYLFFRIQDDSFEKTVTKELITSNRWINNKDEENHWFSPLVSQKCSHYAV